MAKSVMQEIMELEQAREDYARDKFRKTTVERFLSAKTAEKQYALLEGLYSHIQEVLPSHQERSLKPLVDQIPADVDLAPSEFPEAKKKLGSAFFKKLQAEVQDIEASYKSAHRDLMRRSKVFNDPGAEMSLARYVGELQITGTPKTKRDVIKKITTAAREPDIGALQFWAKHGESLFKGALKDELDVDEKNYEPEYNAAWSELQSAVNDHRSDDQRKALDHVTKLQKHWASSGIPELLETAKFVIGTETPSMLQYVEPRERTDSETRTFEARANQRLGVAARREIAQLTGVSESSQIFSEYLDSVRKE